MANFTITVGPTGRQFTDLQSAWNSLPATIPVGDTYTITAAAALYTAGINCNASVKTVNGLVAIKPETGASWWEIFAAQSRPLAYDNTRGATIEAQPFGLCIFTLPANCDVYGWQLKSTGTQTGGVSIIGVGRKVSQNLIVTSSVGTVANCAAIFGGGSTGGDITNNVIIVQNAAVPAINIDDANGKTLNVAGNTFICPAGGAVDWLKMSFGTDVRVRDNNFFGFAAASATHISTANSSNNATDLATFYGTSNLTSVTAANQFIDPTLNLRPKTGAAIIGAGVTSALLTTDAFGTTRPASPTIGAAEPIAAPTPSATISYTEANDTSAITANVTISGVAGNISYTEANDTSAITGSVTTPTGTITTGAFKNNTGSVLASLTALTVTVLNLSTMAFVKTFTGVTTNASGIMTLTDALLVSGTQYAVVTTDASGTLGVEKYTAA